MTRSVLPQRPPAAAIVLAAALAACSSKDVKVDENKFPADYRKEIVEHVMTTKAYDPTNIREAAVSAPALKPVPGNVSRYAACLRFNARDELRRYTGLKERIVYFYAGYINQIQDAGAGDCAGVTWQPFPELEKICLSERDKCR